MLDWRDFIDHRHIQVFDLKRKSFSRIDYVVLVNGFTIAAGRHLLGRIFIKTTVRRAWLIVMKYTYGLKLGGKALGKYKILIA